MNPLDELIRQVTALTGVPLMVVDLIVLGYCLKACPWVDNKWIPWITVPCGTILAPLFLGWPCVGDMPHNLCCPELTCYAQVYSQGFLLSCGAWMLHATFLKRFLDSKLFKEEAQTT